MKNKRSLFWGIGIVATLLVTSILLIACDKNADKGTQKPLVVSTIGMINDVVKNIAGEHVNAVGLMGPGVDPHLYKASEGDVTTLAKAKLILYNGLHLEARMSDVFVKMASRTKVVAVSEAVDAKHLEAPPEFDGFYDPHIWFDVSLWVVVVERIRDALIDLMPQKKAEFNKNTAAYIQKMMALHDDIHQKTASIPKPARVLVTAHDAFGYFGKQYGFQVKGLQGISTETEAGTKDVQDLAQFIVDRKIPAIFVESSVPRRHIQAVQAAANAKGWNVVIGGELFADAMGHDGTEEGTYLGMIKHNTNTIVHGLSGKQTHDAKH